VTLPIVVVTGPKCGCANVTFQYQADVATREVEVYVLPSQVACADLVPVHPPAAAQILAQRTAVTFQGTTAFDCLPSDATYTIFAIAKGSGACYVASACSDLSFADTATCKDLGLDLVTVPLNPSGVYTATDRLDFTAVTSVCEGDTVTIPCDSTAALSFAQRLCCTINEILSLFSQPGLVVVETIVDQSKQDFPALLVDTTVGMYKDALSNSVNNCLMSSPSPYTQSLLTFGSGLPGLLSRVDLYSQMAVTKLQNDSSLQVTRDWTGLALYRKSGCDPQAPGYEDCGQIAIPLDTLRRTRFATDLVQSISTASILSNNTMVEDSHTIALNYGRIALYALEAIEIARLTEGHAATVSDAQKLLVDCDCIADATIGNVSAWFGGTRQDIATACLEALATLGAPAAASMDSLALEARVTQQGTATLTDTNCDLRPELLKGQSTGMLTTTFPNDATITDTTTATR